MLRLAARPSASANRAPARPANTRPIASSMPRNIGVRRAYGAVKPPTCSTNVRDGQSALSQKNLRTPNRTSTEQPPIAASSKHGS